MQNLGHEIMMRTCGQYRIMNTKPQLGESFSDALCRTNREYGPQHWVPPYLR